MKRLRNYLLKILTEYMTIKYFYVYNSRALDMGGPNAINA